MTVNAGETSVCQHDGVHIGTGCALPLEREKALIMTITTFERVIFLESLPLALREIQTMLRKFFRCINRAANLSPNLPTGLDFTNHFVRPFVWHMTIRTSGAYTGSVAVVNTFSVSRINVIFHFVAANTKLFSIGNCHCPVEQAHIRNSGHKEKDRNDAKGNGTSVSNYLPVSG